MTPGSAQGCFSLAELNSRPRIHPRIHRELWGTEGESAVKSGRPSCIFRTETKVQGVFTVGVTSPRGGEAVRALHRDQEEAGGEQ